MRAVPASDDRWDVVVVGLRDPSHAAAMMAVAELAHYASLPPEDVERMLEDGEVLVLESLDRAEAERAAYELAELGAVVDLRLAMNDSGVFPVFKPDAERQIGVAVGGLIDDSATPPTVGAAVGLPQLEPIHEAPQAPRARTRTPSPDARAGGRAPADAPRREPMAGPPGLDEEPPPPPLPRAEGRGEAAPRARTQTPAPARPTAQTSSPPRPPAASIDSLLGDIGPATPAAAPKLPQRLQRAVAAAQSGTSELEVDFAAAGINPPPKRGPSAAPAPAEPGADRSASNMPRRTRAGHTGGTGASAAGHGHTNGGLLDVLRNDGIAAVLVGLAVALVLSLVLALQVQRGSVRDRLPPLEDELAAALADPDDVAAGKRRDPGAIESELEGALDDLQRSFLLWWLAPGVLGGLLLSRLKAL